MAGLEAPDSGGGLEHEAHGSCLPPFVVVYTGLSDDVPPLSPCDPRTLKAEQETFNSLSSNVEDNPALEKQRCITRREIIRRSAALSLLTVLAGCGSGGGAAEPGPRTFIFDLNEDGRNWTGGFADLPADTRRHDTYELRFEPSAELPAYLAPGRRAALIAGHNRSDDLFMFVRRRLTGLVPNARYRAEFEVEVASNAPSSYSGIGGAPGVGVYVRAGITPVEPRADARIAPGYGDEPYLLMNIDKGNQSKDGADVVLLGDIGIPGDEEVYRFKTLTSASAPAPEQFFFTTDAEGGAWLMLGTDSAFEGLTTLYYVRTKVTLTPA